MQEKGHSRGTWARWEQLLTFWAFCQPLIPPHLCQQSLQGMGSWDHMGHTRVKWFSGSRWGGPAPQLQGVCLGLPLGFCFIWGWGRFGQVLGVGGAPTF